MTTKTKLTPDESHRLTLENRLGQAHLEPGMSLAKMAAIMKDVGITDLQAATLAELERVAERVGVELLF